MSGLGDSYKGGDQFAIKSIKGDSTSLNCQRQAGGVKPSWTGKSNPGGTHPGGPPEDSSRVPTP